MREIKKILFGLYAIALLFNIVYLPRTVIKAEAKKVSLNTKKLSMHLGNTFVLKVKGGKGVKWSCSNY